MGAKKKQSDGVVGADSAPQFQVVDQVFVWADDGSGAPVRIPLRFKMKLLRAVMQMSDLSELEQLFALLDGLNDEATQAQIDEMWADEALEMTTAYFGEFEKFNRASLGE